MDNNSVLPSCTLYYPNSGIIIHPNGTMDIINYEWTRERVIRVFKRNNI
jgi:ubiquinone biosynthesis protein COQ9